MSDFYFPLAFALIILFPPVQYLPENKSRKKKNRTDPVKTAYLLLHSGMQFTYTSGPNFN